MAEIVKDSSWRPDLIEAHARRMTFASPPLYPWSAAVVVVGASEVLTAARGADHAGYLGPQLLACRE